MKAFAIRRGEEQGELVGKILCHDIRPAFRKGHLLRAEDIPVLMAASWSELHLLEPGAGTSFVALFSVPKGATLTALTFSLQTAFDDYPDGGRDVRVELNK